MSKKKIKRDCIVFCGESANDVTGSMYYIQFGSRKILIECGLHQASSNSYLDSYRINSAKFPFKPGEIDYVFVVHPHIDHCGLLPRLVKEGFNGRIITTGKSAAIMKALLTNSSYIVQEEARILSKRYKRNYQPLYDPDDVTATMRLVQAYDGYNVAYDVDETVSFEWLRNSHCVGAAQLKLTLHDHNKTKRILYTSDIGAISTRNHYVDNTEVPQSFADVAIMESTYGAVSPSSTKGRGFDIKHLASAINTVTERGGSMVFPCFSFSRTQEILTALYVLHQSNPINVPIVVDSQLSCDLCKIYGQILNGDNLQKWLEVYNWDRVRYITDKSDSQVSLADHSPRIIISSSGFCTNGRVVNYLKKYLRDPKSMIVFTGYTGDNPSYLSYRIKNYRDQKFISINKEKIPNKADCITLSSFSSHANQYDLIKYGSSLNVGKLLLVHGSDKSKRVLSEKLRNAISKNNKSYRAICSTKGMIVYL